MLSSRFLASGVIAGALGTAAVLLALSSSYGAEPATAVEKRMEDWVESTSRKGDTVATRALLNFSGPAKRHRGLPQN